MGQNWSGPALAVIGLAAIAAAALLPGLRESPLGKWTLMETLAPARVLPLIGFGAAFGLLAGRAIIAALLLFGIGVVIGLVAEDRLLWALDSVPQAANHLFMTGPISYLAAGAALVASKKWRSIVAPAAAIIVGAMQALIIKLTDPSLHEPVFTWTPVLISVWIVVSVSLTLRVFRREWFIIAGRILGSWLIAIGLLYGGASLVPNRGLLVPPSTGPLNPPDSTPLPGDRRLPGLDRSQDQPNLGIPPDDLGRFRQ
jgi:hypothetical protein